MIQCRMALLREKLGEEWEPVVVMGGVGGNTRMEPASLMWLLAPGSLYLLCLAAVLWLPVDPGHARESGFLPCVSL